MFVYSLDSGGMHWNHARHVEYNISSPSQSVDSLARPFGEWYGVAMGESQESTAGTKKCLWLAPPVVALAFILTYVAFFWREESPVNAGVPRTYRSESSDPVARELVTGGYVPPLDGPAYNWHTEYAVATKLLIIRSVHFDARPRNGHNNASVFLVEVDGRLVEQNLLVQCQVGSHVSDSLAVRVLHEGALTHAPALVDCYDLPLDSCSQRAFLYFKTSPDDEVIYTAESEKRFNPPSQPPMNNSASIVACLATLHGNNPPSSQDSLFYEWVRHLKKIGVDHIHMIAENSFLYRGGFVNPTIYDSSMAKYLSVNVWTQWLNESDIRDYSKILGYNDCIYRYLGVYQYALILDWNTFFVPDTLNELIPCEKGACHYDSILQSSQCTFNYSDIKKKSKKLKKGASAIGMESMDGKGPPVALHTISGVLQLGLMEDSEVVGGYETRHVPSSRAYFTRVTVKPGQEDKC